MIIIVPLDGKPIEYFENYDGLFECLTTIENLKLLAKRPNVRHMNWSFTVHPPLRAAALYAHSQDPCAAMEEAFGEGVPLIEICIGDYKKPLYIALTPNIDLDYLKKEWCVDYCTYHHLLVKEL